MLYGPCFFLCLSVGKSLRFFAMISYRVGVAIFPCWLGALKGIGVLEEVEGYGGHNV